MSERVIEIEHLTKYYDGRCVLDDLCLSIPRGSVYGLLGRNGVGKTTLIRILLGLEPPTRGRVKINQIEPQDLTALDRSKIGYVAEGHNLIQRYKVEKLINLCKDIAINWDNDIFKKLTDLFNIPMQRRVKELSTGMRAQLNLALSLSIDPEILILDDPSLGLDTVVRRQFLELAIEVIQKEGRTILFSSHILSDVERIADHIGILLGGQLVANCTLESLKDRVKKLRIIFSDQPPSTLYLTDVINQKIKHREMTLTIANYNEQKQRLIEAYYPESIDEIPLSLEDIFIECTDPQTVSLSA